MHSASVPDALVPPMRVIRTCCLAFTRLTEAFPQSSWSLDLTNVNWQPEESSSVMKQQQQSSKWIDPPGTFAFPYLAAAYARIPPPKSTRVCTRLSEACKWEKLERWVMLEHVWPFGISRHNKCSSMIWEPFKLQREKGIFRQQHSVSLMVLLARSIRHRTVLELPRSEQTR